LDRLQRVARTGGRGGTSPDGAPVLTTELRIPEATRHAIDAQLAAVWRDLAPTAPEIAVRVIVVDLGSVTQVLPPVTDGRTCIVELPVGWSLRWMVKAKEPPPADQLAQWLRQGLGPCAFYAAFGRPGPAVEAWLLDRGFDLGYDMDWVAPPPPGRWYGLDENYPATLRAALFWMPDSRYGGSLDAVACNAGDLRRCRAALFASDTAEAPGGWRRAPRGVVNRPYWLLRSSLYGGSRYLADLVRDAGRDRFETFWRSSLPVDSAFQLGIGVPIETWTARWQRERMGALRPGSGISPLSVLLSLLVTGLFLAGATYLTRRRQVA
jgi:hypothetical protein